MHGCNKIIKVRVFSVRIAIVEDLLFDARSGRGIAVFEMKCFNKKFDVPRVRFAAQAGIGNSHDPVENPHLFDRPAHCRGGP